ncbi:MAG: 16S rRNA (cytidine(1402)-2'-O)-methyltransferase [Verrucomicrobiales bacterium]|nr:16S rRNA (cytidine(1402)-2'-O)-methyltransferase [Verrucomicrobiales bacterium]MDP4790945.1 16S rRNA (cytidine(1402)-2'-O)-methyltransferase [Verrucomicrobiales bacterium]MDP4938161.1 16S rRNA (cytidine(1402)-2'-O)-methyltransferase [Verrucomicrobiales bacterium]MDP5006393.1 16S rRNA (cytidine(1402)-2'-O)-methyltransferase [Verrucomicrobiales bacterium]
MNSLKSQGLVQLIGTPIGNLGDITFRAVESIKAANVVACEDTRHSQRLLSHLGISGKELVALHEHNEQHRAQSLVERAMNGERIVFLSDAGTPTISDPGYRLVNACHEAGVRVEVIPGPSAVITALAGSGLPTDAFYFGGFLAVKSGRKGREIEEALARRETSVFFESPHRLIKTVAAIAAIEPDREICVARELTKKFETYHRGTASQLLEYFTAQPGKGEITLLIRGCGKRREINAD